MARPLDDADRMTRLPNVPPRPPLDRTGLTRAAEWNWQVLAGRLRCAPPVPAFQDRRGKEAGDAC